jgi:hypothetical protein
MALGLWGSRRFEYKECVGEPEELTLRALSLFLSFQILNIILGDVVNLGTFSKKV